MLNSTLLHLSLKKIILRCPYLHDFFDALDISITSEIFSEDPPLESFILAQSNDHLAQFGLEHQDLIQQLLEFIQRMEQFQKAYTNSLCQMSIMAGFDKSGNKEPMNVTLCAGEVVSVVGPTGSGKSRLLADIECLAQGDTPSGRKILLDGKVPDEKSRFSGECRLVAQLSQNMNFVMDLTVEEFLTMHAESRLIDNIPQKIDQIFQAAVLLAGEPFTLDTAITALSGGQSRALMIADVAYLSASPIVLIDEIENAGVDRQKAVALLVKEEKIVFMATHDPLLALSGHRRIVIKNGGILDVIETTKSEQKAVTHLAALEKKMGVLREKVRNGSRLDFDADNLQFTV